MGTTKKTKSMLEAENARLIQRIAELETSALNNKAAVSPSSSGLGNMADPAFATHLGFVAKAAEAGFATVDHDGTILIADETISQMSGYSLNELVGLHIKNLDATQSAEEIEIALANDAAGATRKFQTSWRRKDGQLVDVEILVFVDPISDRRFCLARNISAVKETERSFNYLLNIVNSTSDAIVLVDTELHILDLNVSAEKLYCLRRADAVGQNVLGFVESRTMAGDLQTGAISTAIKTGRWVGALAQTLPDGREIFVSVSISSSHDTHGDVDGYVLVIRDITHQKLAEDAYALSETRLRDARKMGKIGHFASDSETGQVFCSKEIYETFGLAPGTPLTFRHIISMVHPDDLATWESAGMEAALSGQDKTLEYRVVWPDKTVRWHVATIATKAIKNGCPTQVYGQIQDVTDRKATLEALRKSEEGYSMLTENISDVIWVLDVNTNRFTYITPSVEQLRGFTVEEVMARDMHAALSPESQEYLARILPERFRNFAEGVTGYYTDEIEQPKRDGSTVWTEVTSHLRVNSETSHLEVVGVTRDISERRKTEIALRESEARYRSVVDSMAEGVIIYTADGQIVSCNSSAEEILGMSSTEVSGRYLMDPRWQISREDGSRYPTDEYPVAIALRTGQAARNVVMRIGPPEDLKFISVNAHPIISRDTSKPLGVVVTFADISEQRRGEAQIAFQAHILGQVRHAVLATDLDGHFIYWNKAAEDLFGVPPEDVIGRDSRSYYPDGNFTVQMAEEITRTALTGQTWKGEFPAENRKGESLLLDVTASLVRDQDGQPFGLIGVVEDISERRKAEEAHSKTQAHLKAIFDLAGFGLIMVARDGQILQCNKAMADLFGYTEAELLSLTNRHLTPPEDIAANDRAFAGLMNGTERSKRFQKRYVCKDGLYVWCDTSITGLYDANGKCVGFVGATTDITARIQLEEQLKSMHSNLLTIVENTEDIIALHDAQDNVILSNQAFKNVFSEKWGAALQINELNADGIDLSPQHIWADMVAKVLRGERVFHEMNFSLQSGKRVYLEITFVPVFNGEKLIGYGEYIHDVTKNKEIEIALEKEKERYRTVADFTYNWESWSSPEGEYQYVSPSFERITGYSPEELIKSPALLVKITHPEDRRQIAAHMRHDRKSENTGYFLFRIFSRNGEMRWIEHACQPVYRSSGEFLGRRGSYSDVTERIKAEEKIRFQATLLNLVGQAVIATDQNGIIIFWSQAAGTIYGWTSAETLGRPVRDYVDYLGDLFSEPDLINASSLQTKPVSGEAYVHDKSEARFPVSWTNSCVLDERGELIGLISVSQNISDRVESQSQLDVRLKCQQELARLSFTLAQETAVEKSILPALQDLATFTESDAALLYVMDDRNPRLLTTFGWDCWKNEPINRPFVFASEKDALSARERVSDGKISYYRSKSKTKNRSSIGFDLPKDFMVHSMILTSWSLGERNLQGVVILCNPKVGFVWEESNREFLEVVARGFGVNYQRNNILQTLEERVKRRTLELRTLFNLSDLATQTHDVTQLMRQSLRAIVDAFDKCSGVVYLRNPKSHKLFVASAQEGTLAAETSSPDLEVVRILSDWINANDQTVILNSKSEIAKWMMTNHIVCQQLPAFMAYAGFPLSRDGTTYGTLNLVSTESDAFSNDDIGILKSLASQLVANIETAMLRVRYRQTAILEERQRVARNLHDSINQLLYGGMMSGRAAVNFINAGLFDDAKESIVNVTEISHQALQEMRTLIYELRPAVLERSTLKVAIRSRINFVEGKIPGISVNLTAPDDLNLNDDAKESLYHIVEEALNNILKHSKASLIRINIGIKRNRLVMTIADNGVGFDTRNPRAGLGLESMYSRGKDLSGFTKIVSSSKGTSITIDVPFNINTADNGGD